MYIQYNLFDYLNPDWRLPEPHLSVACRFRLSRQRALNKSREGYFWLLGKRKQCWSKAGNMRVKFNCKPSVSTQVGPVLGAVAGDEPSNLVDTSDVTLLVNLTWQRVFSVMLASVKLRAKADLALFRLDERREVGEFEFVDFDREEVGAIEPEKELPRS